MAERTDSGRLFQREEVRELKALAPVLVLILGMDRVIPLFDLSEIWRDYQSLTFDIARRQLRFVYLDTQMIMMRCNTNHGN